jgi:hypothetical protein
MPAARFPVTRVPTTIVNGKPVSRSLVAHAPLNITSAQLVGANGQVDPDKLARMLTMMQQAQGQESQAANSHPLLKCTVVTAVKFLIGQQVQVKHGLGVPFKHWFCVRVYPNSSSTLMATEVTAPPNGGMDPTQWLVLASSSGGSYDILVAAGT